MVTYTQDGQYCSGYGTGPCGEYIRKVAFWLETAYDPYHKVEVPISNLKEFVDIDITMTD
ncbi:MAG: hypothetical protein R3B69_03690 [Candidatus Paceibacterota bacterium]